MLRTQFSVLAPLFLGVWFLCVTTHALLIYGIHSGMALWFCNIALGGIALGIALRNRDLLIALVAGSCFTQTVWLLDNSWRIVTGKNLFGLAEFLYHPGLTVSEYLLSSYHFFALPCALYALTGIPTKRNLSHWVALGIGVPLFALSYFPFTADHNVNCARESCLPFINRWDNTWEYTLVFATLTIAITLGLTWLIDKGLRKFEPSEKNRKRVNYAFLSTLALGIVLTVVGAQRKAALPKFTCAPPKEDSQAKIECLYTTEYDTDIFLLQYQVTNKTKDPMTCNTKIALFGEYQLMHQDVYVKPGEKLPVAVLLPYPPQDVEAKLTAACGDRDGNG